MKNICLCEKHKKMIIESSNDELIKISEHQTMFMSKLDDLINGIDDPFWGIAEIFMEWKGNSMSEIAESFKRVRENASNIFDIVQEEITKRLDNNKLDIKI